MVTKKAGPAIQGELDVLVNYAQIWANPHLSRAKCKITNLEMTNAGHKSRLRNLSGGLEALEKNLWGCGWKLVPCTIKEQGVSVSLGHTSSRTYRTAGALPSHPELVLLLLDSDIYHTKMIPENPRVKRKGTWMSKGIFKDNILLTQWPCSSSWQGSALLRPFRKLSLMSTIVPLPFKSMAPTEEWAPSLEEKIMLVLKIIGQNPHY